MHLSGKINVEISGINRPPSRSWLKKTEVETSVIREGNIFACQ